MSASGVSQRKAAAALVVFAAIAILGQAVCGSTLPEAERIAAPRLIGRAGWSYIGGLRTFAAAVMWNRIEPIFHEYYESVPLEEQRYMLPWIATVTALDPSLLDPWYVGSWIIARNGRIEEGLRLARRGMEANPTAGLLTISYAQMLFLFEQDHEGALPYAQRAVEPDMTWRSLEEQYEGYAIARDVFRANGLEDEARRIEVEMQHIGELIDQGADAADEHGHHHHDHDE